MHAPAISEHQLGNWKYTHVLFSSCSDGGEHVSLLNLLRRRYSQSPREAGLACLLLNSSCALADAIRSSERAAGGASAVAGNTLLPSCYPRPDCTRGQEPHPNAQGIQSHSIATSFFLIFNFNLTDFPPLPMVYPGIVRKGSQLCLTDLREPAIMFFVWGRRWNLGSLPLLLVWYRVLSIIWQVLVYVEHKWPGLWGCSSRQLKNSPCSDDISILSSAENRLQCFERLHLPFHGPVTQGTIISLLSTRTPKTFPLDQSPPCRS